MRSARARTDADRWICVNRSEGDCGMMSHRAGRLTAANHLVHQRWLGDHKTSAGLLAGVAS